MFEYREVIQCNDCGKIYDAAWGVPHICAKCGNRLYDPDDIAFSGITLDYESTYNTCFAKYRLNGGKKLSAKPTIHGWKIRDHA